MLALQVGARLSTRSARSWRRLPVSVEAYAHYLNRAYCSSCLTPWPPIPLLQAIKRRLPVSVETCAHYLNFAAEDVADGDTRFKCAPPLRSAANRAALVAAAAVAGGGLEVVSSDHSPAPPGMKATDTGDFIKAWGGISGGWGV